MGSQREPPAPRRGSHQKLPPGGVQRQLSWTGGKSRQADLAAAQIMSKAEESALDLGKTLRGFPQPDLLSEVARRLPLPYHPCSASAATRVAIET